MQTYNIFYGSDAPFTVNAIDSWEAREKGILKVESKYPNRTILPYDVVSRQI